MAIALRQGSDGNLTRFDSGTPMDVPGNLVMGGTPILGERRNIISPSTVSATQNNYNPTGWDTAGIVRLIFTGSQTITGLAAPNSGGTQLKYIANIDATDTLTLSHESGSSSAQNRLSCPQGTNLTIPPLSGVWVMYDATSLRWRPIARRWLSAPGSITDNAIVRWDTSTGGVQNSGITISDAGDIDLNDGALTEIDYATFEEEGNHGNSGSTPTISFTAQGQKQRITLNANATFSFTFPGVGNFILKIIQDATGSRTVTLPSSARAAGSAIDLAGSANAVTIWAIYYDGTNAHISSMPDVGTGAPTVNLV